MEVTYVGKNREDLTSGLSSKPSDWKAWQVAAGVRTKFLARAMPDFAYHLLAILRVQNYNDSLMISWAPSSRRPSLQDWRSSEICILHMNSFANV